MSEENKRYVPELTTLYADGTEAMREVGEYLDYEGKIRVISKVRQNQEEKVTVCLSPDESKCYSCVARALCLAPVGPNGR